MQGCRGEGVFVDAVAHGPSLLRRDARISGKQNIRENWDRAVEEARAPFSQSQPSTDDGCRQALQGARVLNEGIGGSS